MLLDGGIQIVPETASRHASQVDDLYIFLILVTLFFVSLICFSILYFVVKYRRGSPADRRGATDHNIPLEIVWSAIPLGLTMVMFVWGAKLYFDSHAPPRNAVVVNVVAKQWMWKFQHPNGRREINVLHLPLGRSVKLNMISEDVIHSFFVSEFRIKQDVLPGRYSALWFEPTKPGTYDLFCAEYCGTDHSRMIGKVIVQNPSQYADWLQGRTGEPADVAGKKLFERHRCGSCHTGKPGARGPSLVGLFGRTVPLKGGGTVTADEAYFRESVLNPRAKVVAGFEPLMPTFAGQINEEGVLQLMAYIQSLSPPEKSKQSAKQNDQ